MFNTAAWIDRNDPVLNRPLTWAEVLMLRIFHRDYINSQLQFYPLIARWFVNYIIKPLVAEGWVEAPYKHYPEVIILTDKGKEHIDTHYKNTIGSYA